MLKLSGREAEVYLLLLQGKTRKEIAKELFIETTTVKSHMDRIYRKCNVHSLTELLIQRIKELEQWINRAYIYNK